MVSVLKANKESASAGFAAGRRGKKAHCIVCSWQLEETAYF